MDILEFITSGILELYCLGNVSPAEEAQVRDMMRYPEVRDEIANIQLALEAHAERHAVAPPAHLETVIGGLIDNLKKESRMQPADLPLINRFSNHNAWANLVKQDIPATFDEERFCKILTDTQGLTQMLVISTTDFEDEVHTDLHESFLILQGSCVCTVGDTVFNMKAGDFMDIPLHAHHDVKINAPFVVAIMQRMAFQPF